MLNHQCLLLLLVSYISNGLLDLHLFKITMFNQLSFHWKKSFSHKFACIKEFVLSLACAFHNRCGRVGCSNSVYPLVIAAHPSEPNQIALGMSDGAVHVVEPSDAELKWGAPPPQENGTLPSIPSNPALSSQASEPPSRWLRQNCWLQIQVRRQCFYTA